MFKDVKSFLESPSLYVLWNAKQLDQELHDRELTAHGTKEVKIQCLCDNDSKNSRKNVATEAMTKTKSGREDVGGGGSSTAGSPTGSNQDDVQKQQLKQGERPEQATAEKIAAE